MDSPAPLPQPIADALARGWTVLTGNQRAARALRYAFDLRQQAQELSHWAPPAILALDSWLASLWHRLLLDGTATQLLLNATQEHSLWSSIIDSTPGDPSLRSRDSLAELASDAWLRLHAYQALHRLHAAAGTTDTRAFARWAGDFQRLCLRSGYLSAAQLPEALAAAVDAGKVAPPPGLLLIGFDFVLPAQAALLDAMAAKGSTIERHGPLRDDDVPSETPLLIDAPDFNSELIACARWVRDRLREDPQARLAVIVPDIAAERGAIERGFRNVLAPELNDVGAPAASGPFEFSLGIPLDRTPLVSAALDILAWIVGPLALDRVSTLLLSPYFAATHESASANQQEFLARAEFDVFTLRQRSFLEPRITIDGLTSLLGSSRLGGPLSVARAQLRTLGTAIRRASLERDRSYGEWSATFQEFLDAAGWAPASGLDSTEFQMRRKWESALNELATLDFDPRTTRVSFRTALDALARIAAQTLFAPESRHAPVQILGPLEAAGSSFDAVWFLRAGDLSWPPTPARNPLLPYSLQRDFAMPGADTSEDTARALRATQRIAASAPVVVFSYAKQTADGRQRPSPVLTELRPEPRSAEAIASDPAAVPIALDSLLDDAPIPPPPPTTLRGGSAILEAQAACGFRAFAERRLFSTELDRASLGLDARDRGSLVHSILHDFWTEVRTQTALRAMPAAERTALLARCIDIYLRRDRPSQGTAWSDAYLESERARLFRLLGSWLDFEANRRAPFIVKSSEEKLEGVAIGPLRLDVRVDRTDETVPASGEPSAEIILDYKTGRADPSAWEGPRPDSPQLPLYAVVSPAEQLAGVAFAIIRPGKEMALSGYQSQQGILPAAKKGQTRNLDAQREEWRQALTALAEEFHAGRALALPKSYPETCRYCRQRLFCRLDPSTLLADDVPSEADDPTDANATASMRASGEQT